MAPTRLELADLGLPALDALDVDALAVLVGPERPLQGLAGFADWRLCGLLSRAIRDESFRPEVGEALLLPPGGRLPVPRIFCFGEPVAPQDDAAWGAQVKRLCQAMRKAATASWAGALPMPPREAGWGRLLLEALLPVAPQRLVLLGDTRVLYKEIGLAREALRATELELVAPVARVELPPRAAGVVRAGAVGR